MVVFVRTKCSVRGNRPRRISRQRLEPGFGQCRRRQGRLCVRIRPKKGAELRHSFKNDKRDLSLELWVEEQVGIEPLRRGRLFHPVKVSRSFRRGSPVQLSEHARIPGHRGWVAAATSAVVLYQQHRPTSDREKTLLFLFGTFNPVARLESGPASLSLGIAALAFAGSVIGLTLNSFCIS